MGAGGGGGGGGGRGQVLKVPLRSSPTFSCYKCWE